MEHRRIKDQDEGTSENDLEALHRKPLLGSSFKHKQKPEDVLSFVTLALTLLTSSQAILIVWSKRSGKYEYSVTTANFSVRKCQYVKEHTCIDDPLMTDFLNLKVEALKCALSLAALAKIWRNDGITQDNKLSTSFDEISVYPIPAALYLVKNLLQAERNPMGRFHSVMRWVYSTSVAMLLTAIVSVFLLSFHLSLAFFLGSTFGTPLPSFIGDNIISTAAILN
ncbi:CMP-sialic acid transporter 4 [Apostasia shenzhenica]|uniref:CMP-sialic acid transporter 4 n=1 Tax=Apostasia shenzhenica TaxID=1088818 RepID=A0A2I0BH19_9ASPA|nr:CMP-sialic acid transporter 4 [Apostasia shenzhenica]